MERTEIVRCTVEYIEKKITDESDEGLTLDEIYERIGYSKFYLNRIFQEQVGATIHQYIKERRLTEAVKKIVATEKSIIEIAEESGYQSHQAFTNGGQKNQIEAVSINKASEPGSSEPHEIRWFPRQYPD